MPRRYYAGVALRMLSAVCVASHVACGRGAQDKADPHEPGSLPPIVLSQSANTIECYDIIEIVLKVSNPIARNPFTDVFVTGEFRLPDGSDHRTVEGFSDSPDGTIFRVRFMPSVPGKYSYSVRYWQHDLARVVTGTFLAVAGKHRGLLVNDPQYPWHFMWSGTSEHYFLNGTTAFLLMGWKEEAVITTAIDRLHGLSVNRIRVLLDGRTDHFWTEPIRPGVGFAASVDPWEATRPDDVINPDFDYTRFNCRYWQKFERILKYAWGRDVIISVIFGWNDTKVHPAAGSDAERRYIRYAVARLSAYSNVTWDLGDDLDAFRSEAWTHDTGSYLYQIDSYRHLATSHPVDNRHQDRTSQWFGLTSFQQWERPLHEWMLQQRAQQALTGRIIPQVNEEYGYEDHYPRWAPYRPPAASADANRRAAWDITMAGGYQTTGETAKKGTGVAPDTGGGWVNGRGDETMTMLRGYAHMVRFFTAFDWWRAEPHDELLNNGAFCLAQLGQTYVVYLPHGGDVAVRLESGQYEARWFNPRTGEYLDAGVAESPIWTSGRSPDQEDWVLRLKRIADQAR